MVELNVCLLFNFTEYWGIILLNTASVWRPVLCVPWDWRYADDHPSCSIPAIICLIGPDQVVTKWIHLIVKTPHNGPPTTLAAAAWSPSSPIGRISTTLAKRVVVHLAAITTRGPDFDAFATSLAGATICNWQIWNTSPHSQCNSTLKLSWTKVEHTHITEKLKILIWEQVWNVALLISSPISVIIYPTI